MPYDNEKTLEKKLTGLRFRLDRRTGAILADDDPGVVGGLGGADDAMMSLLNHPPIGPSATANSSHTALAAAAGYPPWQQHAVKTAYDP